MILSICDDPDILSVFRIVKIIITIIKIVIPIILIVSSMTYFIKSINKAEYTDALNKLIKRSIAAIIIFFVPTFVSLTIKIMDSKNDYNSCIENSTKEGIKAAYVARAKELVLHSKNTLNSGLYTAAMVEVDKLDDSPEKKQMVSDLEKVNNEIIEAREEAKRKRNSGGGGNSHISVDGKYTKAEIINMSESQVRAMSNEQFIEFIGSAARIVYSEYGGVLPSITIAQAILESGYGDKFESNTFNVYGLHGYPSNKPLAGFLRQFDNFYEATYYHYAYFEAYSNVYGNFLNCCANHDAMGAASYLRAYAGGSSTYSSKIQTLINQYNLTQYDY